MSGYYRDETYTYDVEQSSTDFSGFDDITVCRPKLIYFKVTGLRPNTRHFAFLDNTNVTNYVNTGIATINDFKNLARNDIRRNPGEKYINETGFPIELGGPTGSIFTDSEGKIEGVFYLQSNAIVNFPAGARKLAFIDISQLNPEVALSYANGVYAANGGIENYNVNYYTVQKTGTRQVWVDTPDNDSPSNDGGNGDSPGTTGNVYLGPAGYATSPNGRVYSYGARYGKDDGLGDRSPRSSRRPEQRPDRDSGGSSGDGGGGKIICTAMNEAYGFGSFRQKIWLAHSHNMAPEYQIGYHAIFLPWVRHVYNAETQNTLSAKAMRWWGEGFARRRTADIWAQSRGRKRKLSVIVERKLIESLCFVTGWVIKRTGKTR